MRRILLALAAALAAAAMVVGWHVIPDLIFPVGLGRGLWDYVVMGLWVLWIVVLPGATAGVAWGLGGGGVPRRRTALLVLALTTALAGLLVAAMPSAWLRNCLRVLGLWRAVSAPLAVAVGNVWALWLGILAARRIGRGRARLALVTALALVLAVVFGESRIWRERLFPNYGIHRLLRRYDTARQERDCAEALTCFAPAYLRRELGAPPWEPKYRAACEREQTSLGADDRTLFCFHEPMRFRRVAGTRNRRLRFSYHYKTNNQLSGYRWGWQVTVEPHGRIWVIADLRPDRDSEFLCREFGFTRGPAGTVRALHAAQRLPLGATSYRSRGPHPRGL
jgi:hypothetical protein